ncbi:MAG: hypothetical protein QNK23_12525 [Crocinitomicaceae bacterium]|nr:hypothetical protein [Crocinitomicaceae bacterium]
MALSSLISCLLLIISLNGSQVYPIPSNQQISFDTWRVSENLQGVYVFTRHAVRLSPHLKELTEDQLSTAVELLESEKFDFAANIMLYSYSQREASSIAGLTVSGSNFSDDAIEYNKETIYLWKEGSKEEEIKYWNEWLKTQE